MNSTQQLSSVTDIRCFFLHITEFMLLILGKRRRSNRKCLLWCI